MSYYDYTNAIKIIEKDIEKEDVFTQQLLCRKKSEVLDKIQSVLDIKLPRSYRDFLEHVGILELSNEEVYSLGFSESNKYQQTRLYKGISRKNIGTKAGPPNYSDDNNQNYPSTLIPIFELNNGSKFYLDTAQMNEEQECPVVYLYQDGSIEIMYEDFGELLLEVVNAEYQSSITSNKPQ